MTVGPGKKKKKKNYQSNKRKDHLLPYPQIIREKKLKAGLYSNLKCTHWNDDA